MAFLLADGMRGARRLAPRRASARRQLRWPVTGAALTLMAASFALIGLGGARLGPWSLALLVIGVLVMDACVQAAHVINQSVIYDLLPGARSRLTTIYMTTYFIGGALGSAGGSQAYEHWGWAGASITAAGFTVLGLVAWLADYREREDGLRTAARASRAVGTRA